MVERERWGSRLGLILAAAGNAIGIGNLLRFPGQAANHGGGAFMIPYVVCLLLFGLPTMWIAWTVGRFGGRYGHGTTPGMFDRMTRSPLAKYFGVLGVALPVIFCIYYTYIESWCLGYSYFSLTGDYVSRGGHAVHLPAYLSEFLGESPTRDYFSGVSTALVFLLITLGLNVFILYRGVARGIELIAKIAVPLLLLFCVVLAVRVFTIDGEKGSAVEGLAYLWTPDLGSLRDPRVWVAAAGQIFFTLSIGFGSLECYASYLRENDDIALTGLTTASTNEFVEVVFGSLIAIPAAALFFGSEKIVEVAGGGPFKLGMVSMPEVLRSFEGVKFFGSIWFLLLFLAAFTSSVAVCQPVMAFLEDEMKIRRGNAAMLVGLLWFLGTLPVVYFFKYGVLDELDFWAGTIGLVFFSMVEVVLFAWIFGMARGWKELHRGADFRVPRVFFYVMKYVTPVLLLVLFSWWFIDAIANDKLIPKPKLNAAEANRHSYPGTFERDPELLEKNAEAIAAIESGLKRVIEEVGRDVQLWITIDLSAEVVAEVKEVQGDPVFRDAFPLEKAQEWISLQGYHYVESPTGDATDERPRDTTVVLAVEGLHTSPYIWLSRIMMLAFTGAFIGCIAVVWRARRQSAGGSTPMADEGYA